jgi:hypothetical protein
MFGLEKENKQLFQFDLEAAVKKNPKKAKELLEKTNNRCMEIKKILKEGSNKKTIESLGVLLHGYTSLSKVINKIGK